jgi:putative flippase GtrA
MNVTALQPEAQASAPAIDVVIPVYNEEAALAPSVRRLHAYLCQRFPFSTRITIADNASTDGTWAVAQALSWELPGVRAVHVPGKGRGGALASTWLRSDARVLAYMDVDLSTGLDALLPLVAPLLSGHSDVSIGSRLAPGARVSRGARRELISRAYNLLLHAVLGVRFRDAQCGFKAVRADVARRLVPMVENRRWFFDTELLVLAERAGLRIHEVPVDWTDDPDSRVDILATAVEDALGVLRLRLHYPLLRQIGTFGLIGALCTAAYGALFWLLSPLMPAVAANALALLATAVANTAANRRFTYGVRGRSGLAGDHLGGLAAFALTLAVTNLSLAALQSLDPVPPRLVELGVLVGANAAATLARFALLKTLIVDRRRRGQVVPIPRGHA